MANKAWLSVVAGLLFAGAAAAQEPVVVGSILPLTGNNATIGEDLVRGVELAVAKVNAEGGVLGRPLEVLIEDSEGRPTTAIDAARKLVSVHKVPAIVGDYTSGVGIPLGQFLQQSNVLHINPASTSTAVRDIGDWSFSVIGLADVTGTYAADLVAELGYKRVAVLLPNSSFGQSMLEVLTRRVAENGGEVIESVLFTDGRQDYRLELRRLMQGDPDVVVYNVFGKDGSAIHRQAFELGYQRTPWFSVSFSLGHADAAPETTEGHRGIDFAATGPDGPAYREAYKAKYGTDLKSSWSGYTYDGVRILAAAINRANSTDPAAIRAALIEVGKDYPGVTGSITFDADGQRTTQVYNLYQVVNGQVVQENP